MLLNKEFNHFYSNFLITTTTIPADPQFNAVSGGSWQVLAEPRPRRVTTLTITACGEPPTPLPIPQWIIKVPVVLTTHTTPCLTEIVRTNKGRDDSCESNISSFIGAKTTVHIVSRSLISGSSKSPDMISRISTIYQADAITIHTIQCQSLVVLECPKSIRVGSVLLASCWVYIATAVSGCAVYTGQYGHEAKRRVGWIRSPQSLIVLMCILHPTTNQGVK